MKMCTQTNPTESGARNGSKPAIHVKNSPASPNQTLEPLGRSLERVIARVSVERSRSGEVLRVLTGKLLQAQEEERRRLARELHDGLNQELAMLAVELGVLARQIPNSLPSFRDQLFHLRGRTERLSNDLRTMTHQLHPAVLEHLGLVSALRSYCAEFSSLEGIQTWFSIEGELGHVSTDLALSLYRITQEALRNVAKHSGAKEAWVKISRKGHSLHLVIVDRGAGFSPEQDKTGLGLGLISIQERVQLACGLLTVKAAPQEGTRIEVHVPITLKERHHEQKNRKHEKAKSVTG